MYVLVSLRIPLLEVKSRIEWYIVFTCVDTMMRCMHPLMPMQEVWDQGIPTYARLLDAIADCEQERCGAYG